jgi:pimeloyl-ACP methyl ester carboxylesterase
MKLHRVLFVALLLGLAACAPLKLYRTNLEMCTSADPDRDCAAHALQRFQPAAAGQAGYLLGFVELDDQGQLFRRDQLDAVITAVSTEAAREGQDILTVVFVHGWKHSAAPGDTNIDTFRQALGRLAAAENAVSAATGVAPRQVIGVYVGWRGASINVRGLKQLTFWDRKNTAHEVGQGDVTEILNRLELIRRIKDSQALEDGGERSRSRFVIVGHSFGGAVVFSALQQQLVGRFVRTVGPTGASTDAEGFGDLVVLINPAFQAQLYSPLHDISTERATYFKSQLPVLAVLTSERDDATRVAFPIGRWFTTMFEKERKVPRFNPVSKKEELTSQHQANIRALGHFEQYRTHYLRATGSEDAALSQTESSLAESVLRAGERWENDVPGNTIAFPGSSLERTQNSAGRNPYLVVRVDRELIRDHNDLDDPRVTAFITHLILVASQSQPLGERTEDRKRGLK